MSYATPMSPPTHYRRSGRISFLFFPIGLAVSGALSLVLSLVYAYGMVYVPVVQLAFLLPLLYGAGLGGLIAFIMHRAKTRSVAISVLVAFVLTAMSYALSWLPWAYATLARADVQVGVLDVLFPPTFVAIIANIYEVGAWSIGSGGGEAVSGVMLGVCWALEAVFVLVAAPIAALGVAGGGVFCEQCDRWCTSQVAVARLPVQAQADVAARLDAGDFNVLAETARAEPYDNPFLRLDLDVCEGCGATNTLTMMFVHRTQQNNKEHLAQNVIVDHVLIAKDQADWLRRG